MHDSIIILDFGSQVTQLIARRIRELNVYCEIHPWNKIPEIQPHVKGVVLSGSPYSVHQENAPHPSLNQIPETLPVFGICYGAQYLAHIHGGEVVRSEHREYGRAHLVDVDQNTPLLDGIDEGSEVWMSHGDSIVQPGNGNKIIASTHDIPVAAFASENYFGVQFHPEVYHTKQGLQIIRNFVVGICRAKQDWTPASFVEESVSQIKSLVGDGEVIMGLSGGVDSTVAAMLIHHAIGSKLHCIFVNNGLLRNQEFEQVMKTYAALELNVVGVDASQRFYDALKGKSDPEEKRKAIGRTFIEVFEEQTTKISGASWLGQGTIYPDVIESVSASGGPSATIKSHHNVGGLPSEMKLRVLEPLRLLFKDEVRRVGRSLQIPDDILDRHPFPGPGLAIRILGEVTPEKVALLQRADEVWINKLRESGWYKRVWQAGAILLPVQTVGVMGDERTYDYALALRAVSSTDGMTADWSRLPDDLLASVSNEIINKVKGINRVVYDISSKPPATIEWE